jgi:hypothetical protein
MTPEQMPELVGNLVRHQKYFEALSVEEAQWIIRNADEANEFLVRGVKKNLELLKTFKFLCSGKIDPLSGERIIGDAKEVFKGGIDSNFELFGLNLPSDLTRGTTSEVYELRKDFSFTDEWDNFHTMHQMIRFCEKYSQSQAFDEKSCNVFPVKKGNEPFLVRVDTNSDGLHASVYRFEHDILWPAASRPRLVVPQSLY